MAMKMPAREIVVRDSIIVDIDANRSVTVPSGGTETPDLCLSDTRVVTSKSSSR